jgi:hypothetical protein
MRAVLGAIGLVAFAVGCGSEDPTSPTGFDKGTPNPVATTPPTYDTPDFEAVDYPKAPYGVEKGSVVANMKFTGWNNPMASGYDPNNLETIQLADFYNPNNDKPVKVLWVNSSAVWCGPCNQEYSYIEQQKNAGSWEEPSTKGYMILGTLKEDAKNPPQPAKPNDLKNWGSGYEVEFPLVLDPSFKLGQFYPSDAFPAAFLVDTRTMRIVDVMVGGGAAGVIEMIDRIEKYIAQNP